MQKQFLLMSPHLISYLCLMSTMQALIEKTNKHLEKIFEGGGKKAIAKQKEKNKLTARERINYLIDKDSEFVEIGAFAGFEMYEEYGGCPAGGTVGGIGYVSGKQCVIVANDQTVKAGAWFPITGKKNLRLQEIALQNNLPIIYLVDSAGVFLPMQDEIFPDKEHFLYELWYAFKCCTSFHLFPRY